MAALDPAKLVFIDEGGFNTKMTRSMGRCARRAPCYGAVPYGHWGNNTFIAGLRADRIDAPMLLQGAINGEVFPAWIEQELAPTLSEGDIVICDNLNVHKNAQARAAIEARGASCVSCLRTRLTSTLPLADASHRLTGKDRDRLRQDQSHRPKRRHSLFRNSLHGNWGRHKGDTAR